MDEIIQEFILESREGLEQMALDLVELETNPSQSERVDRMFRTIHTIKGTCGFLDFEKLAEISHQGEVLLSAIRKGQSPIGRDTIDALLRLHDTILDILSVIETHASDVAYKMSVDLGEQLVTLAQDTPPATKTERTPTVDGPRPTPPRPAPAGTPAKRLGDILLEMGLVDLDTLVSALELIDAGDPRRLGDILVGMGALQAHELEKATQERSQPHAASTGPSNTGTLRVDIDLLDSLMNLAGELVLSRNQFKAAIGQDKHALSTAFSKLDLITNELQEEVTKTRLQPIGLVWRKLPRLVRDTAQACGKDVALTVSGEETELDRFLLDFLNDPMLHLIRNAIDHGIESPDERIQAGKPTQGAVTINAFYQNGLVNVQISDNGRGLHTDQLRTTAVEKGIVGREAASALTEHEAMHLMFRPGFSTAKSVTSISGRGVGLDVVKTNVESVGGTISIESTPGEGTCFTLRVPLTLAIIPALLASSGQNKFAIPLGHVVELIRIKQSQMDDKLSLVHDIPVIHHGADLVPLVHLDHRLSRRNDGHASFLSLKAQETANVIVVQSHDERFALLVDEMLSTQDIVAKPLDERLKGLQVFSGATILGTGEIALILDIHGVATWTQIRGNAREFTFDRSSIERENTSKSDHHPSTSLLVVGVGEEHRLALPMSAVHRVIKLETHTLEYSANQPVMQVDNEICPAMWLTEFLGLKTPAAATSQSIAIAIKASPKPIVLLADRLIDTVDCTLQLQRQRVRRGIKGSAVVAQKVTDIIDIEAAIQMAHQPRTGPEEHTT